MQKRQTYGLFTTISMIVGIVIGSGIFFKADDVLTATGGDVKKGLLLLSLGALAIIFGSLTLSEFAFRSTTNGGFVGYFDEFVSEKAAGGFGFFQTFIYYPSINVVVSYASAIYLTIILGIDASFEAQILIAYAIMTILIFLNTISRKLGGGIQNVTTIIKLIPLFLIAILGFFSKVDYNLADASKFDMKLSWLTALAPIAFSYDGWPIATSITGEVKNPTKTMPIALICAPIIILISYLLFFLGVTNILEPTAIMELSDGYLNYIFVNLFGEKAGVVLTIFVFIAIVGVVNGLSLGGIRMPQALSEKNIIFSKKVARINPKYQISIKSSIIYFIICSIWMLIHYITSKYGLLNNSDVSEIAIVFGYLTYILLYIKVIDFYKKGEIRSWVRGVFAPICAILTAIFITCGALFINFVNVSLFILTCAIAFMIGFLKCGGRNGEKN